MFCSILRRIILFKNFTILVKKMYAACKHNHFNDFNFTICKKKNVTEGIQNEMQMVMLNMVDRSGMPIV